MRCRNEAKTARTFISLLVIFLMLMTALSACAKAPEDVEDDGFETAYNHLTNEEARELMKKDDVIIIDVRKASQYKAGHLPNAINIYYERFLGGRIPELPDLDQPILVYCDYGGLSGVVADELIAQGYTDVSDFEGMDTWDGDVVK